MSKLAIRSSSDQNNGLGSSSSTSTSTSSSSLSLRSKLNHINTIDDVIKLIKQSSNIIFLTGAGVSVSCGIPDFRSINGIYQTLKKDYPELPDPKAMFDINYFLDNPRAFFKFAKEIFPGQFKPSPSHRFIKYMEIKGKLLRNYTQNIDGLEKMVGINKAITCHGSFDTSTCTKCNYNISTNIDIKREIFSQNVPLCKICNPKTPRKSSKLFGIMKPDIIFFGENLPEKYNNLIYKDIEKCDLLIVMGSSLKVNPVSNIPLLLPKNIPQILINREPLMKKSLKFDVELLGDCDVIIEHLCKRLGNDWMNFCFPIENEFRFKPPSRYIFKGAE